MQIKDTVLIVLDTYDPIYFSIVDDVSQEFLSTNHKVIILDIHKFSPYLHSIYNQKLLKIKGYKFPAVNLKKYFSSKKIKFILLEKNSKKKSNLRYLDGSIQSALITLFRDEEPEKYFFRYKYLKKKMVSQANKLLNAATEIFEKHSEISLVVIPNGRFPSQKLMHKLSEDFQKKAMFYEKGFSPNTYYLKTYEPLSRILPQIESQNEQVVPPFNPVLVDQWITERRSPRNKLNEYSKLWTKFDDPRINFLKSQKTAVFFTSSQDEFSNLGPEWDLHSWENQFEAIRYGMRIAESKNYSLVLRIHPNLASKSRQQFKREVKQYAVLSKLHSNLIVFWHDDPINSYDLLELSDVCFVWGSTIGLEATALGIPTWTFTATYYSLVADVKELLGPSENFDSLSLEWNVKTQGAKKFIFYMLTRDIFLKTDPNTFVSWKLEKESFLIKLARALSVNSGPTVLGALKATLDPYLNRSPQANYFYLKNKK